MARADDLVVDTVADLVRSLVTGVDLTDFLHRLADQGRLLLEARAVGVLVADTRGELHVLAFSGADPSDTHLLDLDTRSGPGAAAYRTGTVVGPLGPADLLAAWPELGRRLQALGIDSAQAVPMELGPGAIGSLSLLGAGARSSRQLALARMLADVAALALRLEPVATAQHSLGRELHRALQSRMLVEQATGMLAQRTGVDVDAAAALLREAATRSGRPLREVAATVIEARGHLA